MRIGSWRSGAAAFLMIAFAALMISGCSIAGKRSTDNGWQVSLVNGRGFEGGDGRYIVALYDGNLPKESISLVQLWSGRPPDQSPGKAE